MSEYRELLLIKSGKCPCCSQPLIIGEDSQYLCKSCDISVAIPDDEKFDRRRAWIATFIFCAVIWTFFFVAVHMA